MNSARFRGTTGEPVQWLFLIAAIEAPLARAPGESLSAINISG